MYSQMQSHYCSTGELLPAVFPPWVSSENSDTSVFPILTPNLTRKPDLHRWTAPRNPEFKSSKHPNLQGSTNTPSWWIEREIQLLVPFNVVSIYSNNTQLMTLFSQKVRLWSSFVIMWNIMNTAFSFTRLALSSVNNLLKNIPFLFLVQFCSSGGVTIYQNNILTKNKDLIAFIYYPLFSSMEKVDIRKENQKLIVLTSQ